VAHDTTNGNLFELKKTVLQFAEATKIPNKNEIVIWISKNTKQRKNIYNY